MTLREPHKGHLEEEKGTSHSLLQTSFPPGRWIQALIPWTMSTRRAKIGGRAPDFGLVAPSGDRELLFSARAPPAPAPAPAVPTAGVSPVFLRNSCSSPGEIFWEVFNRCSFLTPPLPSPLFPSGTAVVHAQVQL